MSDQVFVQVRFKTNTEVGEYNDALYYTQSEYATLTQPQIDAVKQTRTTNWVNTVKNQPAPIELTKQQLLDQKIVLQAQVSDIDIKISVIDAKGK